MSMRREEKVEKRRVSSEMDRKKIKNINIFLQEVKTNGIYYLTDCIVKPGYIMRWFPKNNVSGHVLTEGGYQYMHFYLGEKGDKIRIGFMKYSTKTDYNVYSGTVDAMDIGKYYLLTGPTAYYQPFLANRNETVYIHVQSDSFISIR